MNTDYKTFDCYKVLEIPWTVGPKEIRQAYLKKSKEHHPDVGGSNEQQIKINIAYTVLSNPLERERHDRYWSNIYNIHHSTKSNKAPHQHGANHTNDKKPVTSSLQQLFARISSIFDQALNDLMFRKKSYINTKITNYRNRILKWRREQETLFKQKVVAYEEKFKKTREEQLRLYKQHVLNLDARYFRNSKYKNLLFYLAFILTLPAALSPIVTITAWFFLSELWIIFLAAAITTMLLLVTSILWAWYGFTLWLIVDYKAISINDPECRRKIRSILQKKYSSRQIYIESQNIRAGDPDGIDKIHEILKNTLSSQTIKIGNQKILYSNDDWQNVISKIASNEGNNSFYQEETNIKSNRERYLQYAAEIGDLAERPTTTDTSEEQVARRIAVTFFLMGYLPVHYDGKSRVLVFSDGEEKIIIRFRHRPGAPTNIAYAKEMARLMLANNAQRGYLFCTPGLSQNATKYAQANGITWYSLETMNEWIENVLSSNYRGPSGDILKYTESIMSFLKHIAISLKS